MRPARIFIVRHGESQGNVDKNIYKDLPDYALQLTPKGMEQAHKVGQEIVSQLDLVNSLGIVSPVQFYVSPFWRTRQTYLQIAKSFPIKSICYYEDPRIREQEWGQDLVSREGYSHERENDRDSYGHLYYRFRDGESCADVFDRASDFLGTMFRDFEKPNFPNNVVIVTHGMTMRLILMRFFHVPVEEFETWANPKNCEYFLLERQEVVNVITGVISKKYILKNKLRKHKLQHNFQFTIQDEDKKYFPYPYKFEYES